MTNQRRQGFTIVELLVVIVVIAILAAISIVVYAGVSSKANASTARANAASIQKVAEAYNTDNTKETYPNLSDISDYTGLTRVPAGVTVQATAPDGSNGKDHIGYKELSTSPTTASGGCIAYYDFAESAPNKIKFLYAGAARNGSIDGSNNVACA